MDRRAFLLAWFASLFAPRVESSWLEIRARLARLERRTSEPWRVRISTCRCGRMLTAAEIAACEPPALGVHARTQSCDECWRKACEHWCGPPGVSGPAGFDKALGESHGALLRMEQGAGAVAAQLIAMTERFPARQGVAWHVWAGRGEACRGEVGHGTDRLGWAGLGKAWLGAVGIG